MTGIQEPARPGQLSVDHVTLGGVQVVALHGEIDHTVKDQLIDALLSCGGAVPMKIVVDLSEVTFMDSSGINTLITTQKKANTAQGWLRIAGAQEAVQRVLQIVGVDQIIDCHPTLEHALRH
ncbi:STAS domain-containing protein [Streptomyces sp. NPDC060205]|uniref:STAS domain-containing protein n=1 Tax=Streptomyces sp. NPDC060205 TaxID=3347072 RepID=UPI0036628213